MKFKTLRKIKHLPKIGRTPSFDWLILLSIFTLAMIIIALLSAGEFLSIKKDLSVSLETSSGHATDTVAKTKEEQARELIQKYQAQKTRHANLVAKTRAEVILPIQVATSTATSSPASAATSSPAAKPAPTPTGTSSPAIR